MKTFRGRKRGEEPVDNFSYFGGGGGHPIMANYGEAPPERGTLFRLQVHERVRISLVKVYIDR